MKLLLFDENLSPRLVDRLADIYPGSAHVSNVELDNAFDRAVWEYARQNDFMIVTKDADFSEMSLVSGFPPKIIWNSPWELLHARYRTLASGEIRCTCGIER